MNLLTGQTAAIGAMDALESPALSSQALVVTRTVFPASAASLWQKLTFYEEIRFPPPLFLRLLLPVPTRADGAIRNTGDIVKCHYAGGHLLKRITEVTPEQRYTFDVVDQHISIGRGIRLVSGSYALLSLSPDRTEIQLSTRFVSPNRPRWLWKAIEATVCHSFHRYILRAIWKALALRMEAD